MGTVARRASLFVLLLASGVVLLILSLALYGSGVTELWGISLSWMRALVPLSLALLVAALGYAAFGLRR